MATTKKIQTTKMKDEVRHLLDTTELDVVPEMDGYAFRWMNLSARSRTGWARTIWKPVTPQSEIGDKVREHLQANYFQNFEREDGQFFYHGPDMVLAFAPVEAITERRKLMTERADNQLRVIMEEHGSKGTLRHTVLPREPKE